MNVIATTLPPPRVLTTVIGWATGVNAFVGKAAVEAEIVDSLSGMRIMAAVDERAGGRTFKGSTKSWSDVKEAYDYWAERLRARLEELRAKQW